MRYIYFSEHKELAEDGLLQNNSTKDDAITYL